MNLSYEKRAELYGEYDVVVCGGGPAGWVAAAAAARRGCRTALIERFGFLGGSATAGLVVPISGYFKNGQRVVGGIPWEFEQEMEKLGAALVEFPKGHVSVDPEYYKLVAQRIVLDAGVDLYTNSFFSSAETSPRRIDTVIAEGIGGPAAFKGKYFIDATGNGDLCAAAGVPMRVNREPQPLSLCFELTGVDVTTPLLKDSIHHDGKGGRPSCNNRINAFLDSLYQQGKAPMFGGPWFNTLLNGDRIAVNITRSPANALDGREYARAEFQLREDMFHLVDLLRKEYPEFRHCTISSSAVNAGVREGRHLCGVHQLTVEELLSAQRFPDAIARNAHPIDIHRTDGGAQTLKAMPQAGYIPYRSLISPDADNLLVCGRAISADDMAHASIRVQATAMATGEAAGTAAALCVENSVTVSGLDTDLLRRQLTENGAII